MHIILTVVATPGVLSWGGAVASSDIGWLEKVDPWVLSTAEEQGQAEFLVMLGEQADLSAAGVRATKLKRGRFVYERLTGVARRTQGPVLDLLRSLNVAHQSYWVANMIWVRSELGVIERIARLPQVSRLDANPQVRLQQPSSPENTRVPDRRAAVVWNIDRIRAPEVWAKGFAGQGVVIAGQDTGYEWDHPALINQYRGWDGSSVDHSYNWHDAIHEDNPNTFPGNPCGFGTTEPCDDHGHGTHTMGTMVGEAGDANRIGVAPGAKWIGCRNMEQGWGSPATYAECFQWFIAPTDSNDQNPDPARAPHVINNSWACPPSEGCTEPNALKTVVENTRAAGIVVVSSAGNSGPECATVDNPVAIYDAALSVGATDSEDGIASFSSRGPVTVDGSGRLKPDISAPGVGVLSSYPGARYIEQSGTSMAAPHVAGLVALLISANPLLVGQVEAVEAVIKGSAVPLTTSQTCGVVPGDHLPNYVYGYGRIDAFTAVNQIGETLLLSMTPSAESVEPGEILAYTLAVTHTFGLTATKNVVLTDTVPIGTSFVTATLPHEIAENIVRWEHPGLKVGESWNVNLRVRVNESSIGEIANYQYGVKHDGVKGYKGEPVTFTVPEHSNVGLTPEHSTTARPASTVTYTHTLHNAGNIAETVVISHTSSQGWTATYTSTFTFGPDQTAPLFVELTVPSDVISGTVDTLVLTATSLLNPKVFDRVTDTTTIIVEKPAFLLFLPSLARRMP